MARGTRPKLCEGCLQERVLASEESEVASPREKVMWRLVGRKYRGTLLIGTLPPVGPCSSPCYALGHMVVLGGWVFLMSEVSLWEVRRVRWCPVPDESYIASGETRNTGGGFCLDRAVGSWTADLE